MFDHPHPFDPTYGYDLERLLAIDPPSAPDDFDEFWRETYQAALATPPVPETRLQTITFGWEIHELTYTGLGGFRVGGWLLAPHDGAVARGFVVGHGYGGREAPDLAFPLRDSVVLFPCARGFHRSARPDLPDNGHAHVLHGLDHRETYVHRFCVADLWSAASVLAELYPELGGRYSYSGTSFGGGIGAMALPWDHRLERALLVVPSFGHHPLRLTMPCVGSGEAVRQRYAEQPAVAEVLRYFDAASHATRCACPVLCAPALFDPAVPPPGQFAVYNALTGPKELFCLQAGHHPYPAEAAEARALRERFCAWWAA